jgi:hypothetical protein
MNSIIALKKRGAMTEALTPTRPHQSLGNRTPDAVYSSGEGGGASIVDHFGGAPEPSQAVSGAIGEGLAPKLPA